jgi:hypothetical protein
MRTTVRDARIYRRHLPGGIRALRRSLENSGLESSGRIVAGRQEPYSGGRQACGPKLLAVISKAKLADA